MKNIIYAAAVMYILGTNVLNAETFVSKTGINNGFQTEKKKKLTEEELPVMIRELLKSDEYKDWKFDQAYLIEGTSEYYKIELKKDDQKQILNLDKYGNKVSVPES